MNRASRPARDLVAVDLGRVGRVATLAGFAVYFGLPLIWLLLAPTKTDAELRGGNPFSFGSLENVRTAWDNLMLFNDGALVQWIWNSIYYSLTALVITVVTSLLAGYALAWLRVPGKRPILLVTLVTMIMPPSALVLPLFQEIRFLGLVNTGLSVILPASMFPFGVYLFFIYFSTTMPRELMEAARLDGCSEFQVFRHLVVPLSKPMISLVAFFSFTANWNNYFLPFVMLTDDSKYNLPVGLGALIASAPGVNPALTFTSFPIRRPEVALAGLIVVLPIAIIFVLAQRALVRGTLGGAVKE